MLQPAELFSVHTVHCLPTSMSICMPFSSVVSIPVCPPLLQHAPSTTNQPHLTTELLFILQDSWLCRCILFKWDLLWWYLEKLTGSLCTHSTSKTKLFPNEIWIVLYVSDLQNCELLEYRDGPTLHVPDCHWEAEEGKPHKAPETTEKCQLQRGA